MDPTDLKFNQRLGLIEQSVRTHHSFLVNYAHSITQNWADAEDVVSALWKYATVHLKEEHINCLPILRRKVYFLSIDCIRRRRGEEELCDSAEQSLVANKFDDAFTPEEETALAEKFWSELGPLGLTKQQQQATWDSIRFSYTYAEIATRLGISQSTVGEWVAKGRCAIKKAMQ